MSGGAASLVSAASAPLSPLLEAFTGKSTFPGERSMCLIPGPGGSGGLTVGGSVRTPTVGLRRAETGVRPIPLGVRPPGDVGTRPAPGDVGVVLVGVTGVVRPELEALALGTAPIGRAILDDTFPAPGIRDIACTSND